MSSELLVVPQESLQQSQSPQRQTELDPDIADMLNLDQSLFDEYLIRNIKMRQSTPYYVAFDCESGKPDAYETILRDLKPGITEKQFREYYDNVITNDQCVIEYDFPLVSIKRILHVKQGGFSIRELCGVVARDLADVYREQLWVPGVSLQPKDLYVNTFFVFHEPITVPADPNLCVTRISLGIEPKVITKLKELTEQSKSKGSIKLMMKKITEIAQENAMNAVQAPIIEVEPIMNPPQSLATLADSLPDEDEEHDEVMAKIVNEILPAVSNSRPKKTPNPNTVANNRLKLGKKFALPNTQNDSNSNNSFSNSNTMTTTSESDDGNNSNNSVIVVEAESPKKGKRGRQPKAAPKSPKKPVAKRVKTVAPDTEEPNDVLSGTTSDVKPAKTAVKKRGAPKKVGVKKTEASSPRLSIPKKGGIENMFGK